VLLLLDELGDVEEELELEKDELELLWDSDELEDERELLLELNEDELELVLKLDDDELELLMELAELDDEAEALLEKQWIPHLTIRSISSISRSLASKTPATSFSSQMSPLRNSLPVLSAPKPKGVVVMFAALGVSGPPTK